jgi:DeoR family suf operon transcriptional repressor
MRESPGRTGMSTISETSDAQLLELLRREPMSISQLVAATSVTATAVRQRLSRLMGQGMVARQIARGPRGRPSHRYGLTEKARRQTGSNFADLAMVLWNEIRAVKDVEVRRGLLSRLAQSMAAMYAGRVAGASLTERMRSLGDLFAERGIPLKTSVAQRGHAGPAELPVLTVVECPYPELAEQDRGICAVEKMLFEQLLSHDIKLAHCRLDGHACCDFAAN